MPSKAKIQAVSQLVEKLTKNPNFAVIDFDGASHQTIEELRGKLFEKNSRLSVLKNSLFKVALDKIGKSELAAGETLKGQSALVTLTDDWSSTMREFYNFSKGSEHFTFKVGIIDGKVYFKEGLDTLAQLPPREELIIKIISSMKTPQSRLVYSMNFAIMRLINVFRQKGKQN